TRSDRDWSSDVCSSDLECPPTARALPVKKQDFGTSRWQLPNKITAVARGVEGERKLVYLLTDFGRMPHGSWPRHSLFLARMEQKIGRASCRERVEVAVR